MTIDYWISRIMQEEFHNYIYHWVNVESWIKTQRRMGKIQ